MIHTKFGGRIGWRAGLEIDGRQVLVTSVGSDDPLADVALGNHSRPIIIRNSFFQLNKLIIRKVSFE